MIVTDPRHVELATRLLNLALLDPDAMQPDARARTVERMAAAIARAEHERGAEARVSAALAALTQARHAALVLKDDLEWAIAELTKED